jgi:fatty acid desaturase
MTQQAHMLAVVLMVIMILLLMPLLLRWIGSPLLVFVVFILLFVPVFVVSHWLADVLLILRDTLLRENSEEAMEEDRRPRRQDPE